MLIPSTISDWTLDLVVELLEQGFYETEWFDFKQALPSDESGKLRLTKACAAFANSNGGFLIFGITDDRFQPSLERMIGISNKRDFPEHFGVFPQKISPSVKWDFKNPPLQLASGNVVYVVYIPSSWQRPHAVVNANGQMLFPKRTNKGNELMDPYEVRQMFLGYYEKRLKLQLLRAELEKIIADAKALVIPNDKIETQISLSNFEMNIVETVLTDTYTILSEVPELISVLLTLRSTCRNVNTKLHMFYGSVGLPLNNKNQLVRDHNKYLHETCPSIIELANRGAHLLDQIAR